MTPLEEPGAEGDTIDIEDEATEIEPMKVAASPKQPTAQEEEEHRIDHADFRSWCRWCVMGRARGMQHRHGAQSAIPIVGIDYFFITKEGVRKKKELATMGIDGDEAIEAARQKGEIVKCILVRCLDTKCLFAHCVPCKGIDEDMYVVNMIVEDILWLGHLKMILKADGESHPGGVGTGPPSDPEHAPQRRERDEGVACSV